MDKQPQRGMFLLEALIAILIFSLGILGMVAMGGTAIAAQSDAQYRTDAANFANEIASKIALNVDPTNHRSFRRRFRALPISRSRCRLLQLRRRRRPTSAIVLGWVDEVRGAVAGTPGLPGATTVSESIAVDTSQATTAR